MRSFLQGKKTITTPALQPSSPKVIRPATGITQPANPVPTQNIEVIKEGDKVVRLVITCVCGERMEVECLYKPGA